MADMTKKAPVGIVENVLEKIDKFLFPFDFMINDMLGDPNETMILGRPFLATIHARIDVFYKEISLGVEDKIVFDMNGNVHHPTAFVEKVCVINEVQKEKPFSPLKIGAIRRRKWITTMAESETTTPRLHYSEIESMDWMNKEEKRWESGLDEKYYDPPQVCIETFEVKRYSLEEGKSFVCVTKQLEDALPLGWVNGSKFKGMIRDEMDTGGSVQMEA
ncbi:reverse transcriptase domain-containing protein [Tanacetum coccineum]|uniref:Reverse transcriptase domain-containing protein n=1 Tax=Tanacetum coccineum TaxID=301880 RepID=A0ABQ5CUH2_9ASTR